MILYKYFPCNVYTFRSLAVKGIWCHTYDQMNDPFECLAVIERHFTQEELDKHRLILAQSNIERWQRVASLDNERLSTLLNEQRKKILKTYAFSSFSEDPNNILLWSHYANSHSGIVIGFEFPELEIRHDLQKVNYQNELTKLDLEKYSKYLIGETDEYLFEILKDYSTKSTHWSYEREWRIWMANPCYYLYKEENIKEVHFGLNMNIEDKAIVLQLLNYLPKSFLYDEKEMTLNPLGLKS